MPIRHRVRRSFAAVAFFALRTASSAAAEEASRAPQAPPAQSAQATLAQEWVGIELTPVAMALPGTPASRDGHVSTFQAGLGGNLRFGRHRWEYVYAIPLQAGLFVSSLGTETISAHVQTEGGFILPGTDRRLELGVGVGLGFLAMHYATGCDGSCNLGGSGWLLSLAARFLIIDGPSHTLGVNVRAVFPQGTTTSEVFGYYVGGGNIVLAGAELAFGRS